MDMVKLGIKLDQEENIEAVLLDVTKPVVKVLALENIFLFSDRICNLKSSGH